MMTCRRNEKRITGSVKSNQVDNKGKVHLSDGNILISRPVI